MLRLTTDDSPLLVHVSGTHGAEGYSGSAVQLALLRRWAADPAARPAGVRVALVHALNPFGFHPAAGGTRTASTSTAIC